MSLQRASFVLDVVRVVLKDDLLRWQQRRPRDMHDVVLDVARALLLGTLIVSARKQKGVILPVARSDYRID